MLESLHPTFASGTMAAPARTPSRALDRRSAVAIVAAIALLLCTAGASVWQAASNSTALGVAQSTRRDRNMSTDLLLAAQDAETAQRGYLLTGDPMYLEPLQHAEEMIPGFLSRLQASAPGEARMATLHDVLTAKSAELRQTVLLAQRGDLADAMAIVRTNAGSLNMALIRKIIAEVEAEQDAKLVEQVATVSRGSRLLVAIDAAGLIMVLALGGLIALGLRDYLTTLRDAQAKATEANATLERNNDRLDEIVRLRTAELTSVNEEVQRFAYIVSHDLRAPLVNIMGFTSELQQAAATLSNHMQSSDVPREVREAATEEIPEALGFIKTSTQKMDRLINAILKLSREGRRVLVAEQLDMTALLTGLKVTMQHQADARGATVEVAALPALRGDQLAIEQVFGNVVENALKYLHPDRPGLIRVTGRVDGAMARFDVADNGRGIATKDFERVFELFRRAGDQSVPGEGIGLAHVRTLVRRMGGTIECTSELGTGTTFTISVPVVATYTQEATI
jgi:signal transduction histidine kinase